MSMKQIVPVELTIRELYRVYIECGEDATDAEIYNQAIHKAVNGEYDQADWALDREIEPQDVSLVMIDHDAAWTEEEERDMKVALAEAQAPKREANPGLLAISATVDGVEREVQLTPMQVYAAHRVLQDAYDLEDVNDFIEEWLPDDIDSFHEQQARDAAAELACIYRDRLDDDNHWFDVLHDVVARFLDDHANDCPAD